MLPAATAPGPVAQLVEQRVYTASVVGSSPAGSTMSVTWCWQARSTSGLTLRAEASSQAGDGVDEFRESRVLDGEVAALAQNHQVGRTRCSRQNSGAELDRRPRVPTWVQQRHRRAVALGWGVCEPQVGGEKP